MDNASYGDEELPPTPRKTMIDLLSRWTGVPETSLDQRSTEGLRDSFKRASDPVMCAMAAAAILDGGGAIHHYSELKKVRAELRNAAAVAPQSEP